MEGWHGWDRKRIALAFWGYSRERYARMANGFLLS